MSYSNESVKRAIKKYYVAHQEKIKEYSRVYANDRYKNDPEFREKRKNYCREYYHRRKALLSRDEVPKEEDEEVPKEEESKVHT